MRARLVAFSSASALIATLAVAACKLTSGLTGGAIDDAGGGDSDGAACDADTTASVENCGACGNACPVGPNAFAACIDGGCVIEQGRSIPWYSKSTTRAQLASLESQIDRERCEYPEHQGAAHLPGTRPALEGFEAHLLPRRVQTPRAQHAREVHDIFREPCPAKG
jgi:hypothetical protein